MRSEPIFFAPMEGVTDAVYRSVIEKLYPEWDALFSDFLRVPAVGKYPEKHIKKHFGNEQYEDSKLKQKTVLQILSAPDALTEMTVQQIEALSIPRLDLNLGCPSKTVNRRAGGAALLGTPDDLWPMLKQIRQAYRGRFTVKMRLGLADTHSFIDLAKKIADHGVEAITVHARTRDGMYKVPAEWKYIKQAVKELSIPVIGNGDVWCAQDIENMLHETGCAGVMVARGALKSPWMVTRFKQKIMHAESVEELNQYIWQYFNELMEAYQAAGYRPHQIHRQFKNLGRYIFDDLPDGKEKKRNFLLSQNLESMLLILKTQN